MNTLDNYINEAASYTEFKEAAHAKLKKLWGDKYTKRAAAIVIATIIAFVAKRKFTDAKANSALAKYMQKAKDSKVANAEDVTKLIGG